MKYTSRITSRKRRKLVPEAMSTTKKKRAIEPTRQTFSMKLWPTRDEGAARALKHGPPPPARAPARRPRRSRGAG